MIPQEKGLEGLSVYFYVNYPFCLREGIGYVSFLQKAGRFLIPPKLLKPTSGLMGGFD
jgi:hypothetical protein